jgi:hypothetical protein
MHPARSRRVPPPGRALTRASAPRPRCGATGPHGYATATGPRPASGTITALQVRKRPDICRAPASEISQGQTCTAISSPARCTAGKSHRKSTLPWTALRQRYGATGPKETAFFLVRSFRALQVLRLTGSGKRGFTGPDTGSEQEYDPSAAVLCCCTRPNYGLIFSNRTSELWRYGYSNSGPLACHATLTAA